MTTEPQTTYMRYQTLQAKIMLARAQGKDEAVEDALLDLMDDLWHDMDAVEKDACDLAGLQIRAAALREAAALCRASAMEHNVKGLQHVGNRLADEILSLIPGEMP